VNLYGMVGNDAVGSWDYLGLDETTRERLRREREERKQAKKREKERIKRINKHYDDNPTTRDDSSCAITILWGHGGDVERRAREISNDVARCGVLGCFADQPEGDDAIPNFPDVSGGLIGRSPESENGGMNPEGDPSEANSRQGFANLLEAAINAAFAEARVICQETYDTPPCCKEVKITFDGIGARNGVAGNRELARRLKGTESGLNRAPINGVRDGKIWRVKCSEVVR
jgi:hypothetical protein